MALFPPPSQAGPPKILGTETIDPSETLYRVHSTIYPASSYNPCMGRNTRFTHLRDPHTGCIPAMYAAMCINGAFFETVFHDHPVTVPTRPAVVKSTLKSLSVSDIQLNRSTDVLALFTPEQQKLGIINAELTTSPSSAYPITRQWAFHLLSTHPHVDGFMWTSRQDSSARSIILYDRGTGLRINVIRMRDGATDPSVEADAIRVGARGGISIV